MKKLLFLLLTVLMALPSFAINFEVGGICYTTIDGTSCAVTSKKSGEYEGKIDIPVSVSYNGTTYSVTSIGNYAFSGCSSLTSIEIPNSVSEIGFAAFRNCSGLTSVTIPNSVTEIGEDAFSGCSGLTEVVIPGSVTEIGDYAFSGCTGLKKGAYPNWISNPFSTGIVVSYPAGKTIYEGGILYNSSKSALYYGSISLAGNFEILKSVKGIGSGAFFDCSGLTSVTIPNSVTEIGDYAFYDCRGLTEVVIPGSVTYIGEDTFYGCTRLKKGAYPKSVSNPFSTGIAVSYPAGKTIYEDGILYNSSKSALYYGSISVSGKFEIPKSVKEIGDNAFRGCSGLTSVVIPISVTKVGDSAFSGCTGLMSVKVSSSTPPSAKENTFSDKTYKQATLDVPEKYFTTYREVSPWNKFQNITVSGASTKTYSDGVFRFQLIGYGANEAILISGNYSSLKEAIIPESFIDNSVPQSPTRYNVTSIASEAFKNCTRLTKVVIPGSVTSIGDETFSGCSALVSVILPPSLTSLGKSAFDGCTGLIKSIYPNSLTNPFSSGEAYSYKPNNNIVEDGCLFDAQKTSIIFVSPGIKGEFTVPASVKTIGDNAFALCKDITYVRMPSTLSKIGDNVFKGCNLYDFTIPNSVKVFDMGTLAGNPLKSLTVGSGVTQITGTGYFSDSNLEKIFWLGNIPPVGYQGFNPVINFVSNDQYHFSNQVLYPFLSSIFEVGGIVYVPVSPSERTCNVVDYLYAPSNAKFSVPATIENKGIQMKVIDVGAYAFYHHDYLIDIILNNNGVIDDYAFYDCLKLQTVTFGKNIPAIKNHTFQNCEVLKKVENSPALMSIGKWAFSGCVGMEYFSVGKKIESFGEEAFSDCTGLTEFYSYAANPPVCGAQALDDIIKWNCTLYVPEGCESLYASAPQWKDFFYIKGVEDAGIESIRADVKTEVEIFDLNGIKQTRRIEDLPSGIYIVRQGSEVTKKVVK